jgi:hypothetical protein
VQQRVHHVQPALRVAQRLDQAAHQPGVGGGLPVDRRGHVVLEHGGDPHPLDRGEPAGDEEAQHQHREPDPDDQRADADRQPGDHQDERGDRQREAEQRVAGVDAELAPPAAVVHGAGRGAGREGQLGCGGGHAAQPAAPGRRTPARWPAAARSGCPDWSPSMSTAMLPATAGGVHHPPDRGLLGSVGALGQDRRGRR